MFYPKVSKETWKELQEILKEKFKISVDNLACETPSNTNQFIQFVSFLKKPIKSIFTIKTLFFFIIPSI